VTNRTNSPAKPHHLHPANQEPNRIGKQSTHRAVVDPEGLHDCIQQGAVVISAQQPQVTSCRAGNSRHASRT
jgi:hypothetical protein